MSDELVHIDQSHHGVAVVSMCRADKRNALNVALLEQLGNAIERLERDESCRVLILRGEGPVFCAGLDLIEADDPAVTEKSAEGVRKVLTLLQESPLITIAAALGGAYAGGAGLLAACDLVVGADDLQIGFPEVRRGLVAAIVWGVISRKVRDGELRELLLVGEPITAQRAREIGMAQWLVPSNRVVEHAWSIARNILAGAPNAVRETKRLLNLGNPAIDFTMLQQLHERIRDSDEAREGRAAFRDRREPGWCKHS